MHKLLYSITPALAVYLTACDTLSEWNAHPDSYFTRDEKVTIEFEEKCPEYQPPISVTVTNEGGHSSPYFTGAIAAAAAAAAIGLAVDQTVKALEKEKTRFTAKFSGRYTGTFYDKNGIPKYQCFILNRYVGKKQDPAMRFVGSFNFSPDLTAMQIEPVDIYYPKLKAKALWSDNTASVAISIDFRSVLKDKQGKYNSEPTASVALYNQRVPIGEQGLLPVKEWVTSDWLVPIVPSSLENNNIETGNFTMTVTVIETTTTGADIAGFIADTLRAQKTNIIDLSIKNISEQQSTTQ